MAMADPGSRRLTILAALATELDRQCSPAAPGAAALDLDALAEAVDLALGDAPPADVDALSREPDELNAANDG